MNNPMSQGTDAGDPRPDMPADFGTSATKVATDIILSLTLLVLAAPAIALAMVLVKLTSRGPVIYAQRRVGLNGRPYTLYKIRSMTYNCEVATGPRWCVAGDSRVTAVGRFLRRTHLDELPQLVNVLRGEMSLVGPRPERPEFVEQLEMVLPRYRERLLVRPGLTGLAQVQLPPDTDLESVCRKLGYDLRYVRSVSFWLDTRILAATITHVLGFSFETSRRLFAIPLPEPLRPDCEAPLVVPEPVSELQPV